MLTEKRKQLLDDDSLTSRDAKNYIGEAQSEEEAYQNLKSFIQKYMHEILVGECQEDISITEKEVKKLPHRVRHYFNYSEHRGIKYYVLENHNLKYMLVGAFGSTALRANKDYFDQLIKDPDIQSIVQTTTFQLSDLLGRQGKRLKWKQKMGRKWNKLMK